MQRSSRFAIAILTIALIAPSAGPASEASDDEFDWPQNEGSTDHVNEGALDFLAAAPQEPVHHHSNIMTLGADSLVDGWVRLDQCHSNIDNVGRAQIIFRPGRIRGLRITASENIGRAWVEESSVQLTDIGKGSSLCLTAETRALSAEEDGGYRIDNGPFMRRFLDGYYPMRVSQKILLSDSGLTFFSIHPSVQPGFEVTVSAEAIDFDAWFQGRLLTRVQLVPGD